MVWLQNVTEQFATPPNLLEQPREAGDTHVCGSSPWVAEEGRGTSEGCGRPLRPLLPAHPHSPACVYSTLPGAPTSRCPGPLPPCPGAPAVPRLGSLATAPAAPLLGLSPVGRGLLRAMGAPTPEGRLVVAWPAARAHPRTRSPASKQMLLG